MYDPNLLNYYLTGANERELEAAACLVVNMDAELVGAYTRAIIAAGVCPETLCKNPGGHVRPSLGTWVAHHHSHTTAEAVELITTWGVNFHGADTDNTGVTAYLHQCGGWDQMHVHVYEALVTISCGHDIDNMALLAQSSNGAGAPDWAERIWARITAQHTTETHLATTPHPLTAATAARHGERELVNRLLEHERCTPETFLGTPYTIDTAAVVDHIVTRLGEADVNQLETENLVRHLQRLATTNPSRVHQHRHTIETALTNSGHRTLAGRIADDLNPALDMGGSTSYRLTDLLTDCAGGYLPTWEELDSLIGHHCTHWKHSYAIRLALYEIGKHGRVTPASYSINLTGTSDHYQYLVLGYQQRGPHPANGAAAQINHPNVTVELAIVRASAPHTDGGFDSLAAAWANTGRTGEKLHELARTGELNDNIIAQLRSDVVSVNTLRSRPVDDAIGAWMRKNIAPHHMMLAAQLCSELTLEQLAESVAATN